MYLEKITYLSIEKQLALIVVRGLGSMHEFLDSNLIAIIIHQKNTTSSLIADQVTWAFDSGSPHY